MAITFTMSAGDLVTRAMQNRRVLALGRSPTAAEMEYGLERLNQLLKSLAADNAIPWAAEETTATVTAGDPDVTLSPKPSSIVSVGLVVSATNERPLAPWEMGQYDVLPNKASVGNPTIYVVRELAGGTTLRVWPVPSTNQTLHIRYVRVPDDVVQADPVDLPQEWIEGIEYMLAIRLTAFANGNEDLPAAAAYHEMRLKDLSRPDSYSFEADCA